MKSIIGILEFYEFLHFWEPEIYQIIKIQAPIIEKLKV